MKKLNQKGFGIIEGFLILIIVGLIGFVGWYVWSKQGDVNTGSDGTDIVKQDKPKGSYFKDGPGTGWKTYVNETAGFSVKVPKEFLSGYGDRCTKSDDGSYRPAEGLVPTTVVEDGDTFHIAESYTYQLSQSREDGSGISIYDKCEKTTTDQKVVQEYEENVEDGPLLATIPITVKDAKNRSEVDQGVSEIFDQGGIVVTGLKASKDGDWQDVNVTCEDDEPLCLAYAFHLRYYQDQGKLVYIVLGHSGHLSTPDGNGFYDEEVVNSFKLLD